MKKLLVVLGLSALTGCSTMPDSTYSFFAAEWAGAAHCYQSGKLTPSQYSDFKSSHYWAVGTWSFVDQNRLQRESDDFYARFSAVTDDECNMVMVRTYDRQKQQAERADTSAKISETAKSTKPVYCNTVNLNGGYSNTTCY